MKIYIMRHGEAQSFAPSDAERPLTQYGEWQSQQVMAELAAQVGTLDRVWVSPYLRAQQTWQAVASTLPKPHLVQTMAEITPHGDEMDVAMLLQASAEVDGFDSILIISHLPLVGYLAATLVPEIQPPMFATSSVLAIDYDLQAKRGELLWHQFAPDAE
ncbi:phosphohistidine phosphatase SixA [Vibrio stylophorae]|nr:phosphohistidine phosphatase SixA [Vibrio stylophorae]